MTMLTLPFPPSANRYFRNYHGRMVRSAEADAYKVAVGWTCNLSAIELLEGDLRVTIHFYRPAKRMDTDNMLKQLLDALQGYAYVDDKQIVEIHAYRHDDPKQPRAEVEIIEVTR